MNNAVTMRSNAGASLGCIDQYELIRELGGGGFGCVYLARDTVAGIEVAVKGLPPLVRLNKEELENVRQNFALVSRLHHPNIAAALHLQKVEKAFYDDKSAAEKLRVFSGDTLVVMQYAPGVTLSQWRKQFPDGKVPLDMALEITRQIASALDYAHKEKILHRDIKPANVMIETGADDSLIARVLDFGLAAEIRSSMGRLSLNMTDKSVTRHYMAPEQWSGKKQSKETDQYSLAALFYELILGEVPFASVFDTGDTVLMKTVVENDSPEIPHDLPKPVRRAFAKALSKKREDRFASCLEFVDALQGGLISGARASSRAFFSRTAILAAVAAFGLAGAGIWYWQQEPSEPNGNAAREYARRPLATSLREADSVRAIPPVREDARPRENIVPASQEDKEYTGPKDGECKTFTLPGDVTMEMVYVGPGEFMMGSDDGKADEKPVHSVRISQGYWIGKYPVTQKQWKALVESNDITFDNGQPVANFSSHGGGSETVVGINTSDFPMESISWDDCNKLVAALNRKEKTSRRWMIPTEAQWEFAARGGSKSKGYKYSGGDNMSALGWYYENSGENRIIDGQWSIDKLESNKCRPHRVDEKDVGNELGIVGMSGNVSEWCQDYYGKDYYANSSRLDPKGPALGDSRVSRGGCWLQFAWFCRSACRSGGRPGNRNGSKGFRLCCSVGPREDSEENDVVEPQKAEQDDVKRVQLWEGGPYWATKNIGAENPEDPGYYFWWGDTIGYKREGDKWVASDGSMSNFLFSGDNTPTEVKSISALESDGWIEKKNGTYVLTSKHDAAQAHWGGNWRIPTQEEFYNLFEKCDWTWDKRNGVRGAVVRGRGNYASKSIFLPAAGLGNGPSLIRAGSSCNYWSSVSSSGNGGAWIFCLGSDYHCLFDGRSYLGQSVRPVQVFSK